MQLKSQRAEDNSLEFLGSVEFSLVAIVVVGAIIVVALSEWFGRRNDNGDDPE